MKFRALATMTLTLLAVLPTRAQESPEALQEAFMAGLRANDSAALAALYADDAVNYPVASLVGHGPDSVREDWDGFFSGLRVTGARLSAGHLESHGDTAVAWGLFHITAEPVEGGEAIEFHGRYMDVAREIDGRWLYVADHASLPLPASDPEPEPERE